MLWDIWDVYYTAEDGDPPTNYLDIRYCVRDVEPLLGDGATVEIRVKAKAHPF